MRARHQLDAGSAASGLDASRWRSYVELLEYDHVDVKRILSVSSEVMMMSRGGSRDDDVHASHRVIGSERETRRNNVKCEPEDVTCDLTDIDLERVYDEEKLDTRVYCGEFEVNEDDVSEMIDVGGIETTQVNIELDTSKTTDSCGVASSSSGQSHQVKSGGGPMSPSFHRPWQLPQSPEVKKQSIAVSSKPRSPSPSQTCDRSQSQSAVEKERDRGCASDKGKSHKTSKAPAAPITSKALPAMSAVESPRPKATLPAALGSPLSGYGGISLNPTRGLDSPMHPLAQPPVRTPPTSHIPRFALSPQPYLLSPTPQRPELSLSLPPLAPPSPFFHQIAPSPSLPLHSSLAARELTPLRELPGVIPQGLGVGLGLPPSLGTGLGYSPGPPYRVVSLVPGGLGDPGVSGLSATLSSHEQPLLPSVSPVSLEHLQLQQQLQGIHQVFPPNPFQPR